MNETEAMKIYKYSKTEIQLITTTLESLNIKKFTENISEDIQHEINFGIRITDIDEQHKAAYLHTIIHSKDQKSDEYQLDFQIVHKGIFRASKLIEDDAFHSFVEVQIVPQLMPYARSLVSSISVEMHIKPIVLPTMDILRSIMENDVE